MWESLHTMNREVDRFMERNTAERQQTKHAAVGTGPEESHRLWCVDVWSWNLDNEEAFAHWGLLHHEGGEGVRLYRTCS